MTLTDDQGNKYELVDSSSIHDDDEPLLCLKLVKDKKRHQVKPLRLEPPEPWDNNLTKQMGDIVQ